MTQPGRTGLPASGEPEVRLGLRANLPQFLLLAVVNFFVGGMVGTERTVTPLVGSEQFGLGAIAISFFVVVFWFTKAVTNAAGGAVTARYTRKSILVAGWLIGLPVPFMLAWGPSWAWVIAANVLLGVNQGLTWSMTVNMKIDLIGPGRRGVALGINETAGYLGVAVTALAAGLAVITAGISHALAAGLAGAFLLGTGTALVYPSLLAAVSDATHPAWRAPALGVYRFWRDAGYAIGALIGGITAAVASLDAAVGVAAVLTAVSGILAWALMRETHPRPVAEREPREAAA